MISGSTRLKRIGRGVILRKGIVLAGGSGSRLFPVTLGVSKQLLPVFDKPMIYYAISVLMLAGIKEIAIITTPRDRFQFQALLGDGRQWGLLFTYIEQKLPEGVAHAYLLAEEFLDGSPSALILGDNVFFGDRLPKILRESQELFDDNIIFAYRVADPERYGVVTFGPDRTVCSIAEKPEIPVSNFAITGLYFLDKSAPLRAKSLKKSVRGELEIVSLLEMYLKDECLSVRTLGRGYAWLDTGTHGSLLAASEFVRTLQERQGVQIGCPEEIAFNQGWIDREQLMAIAERYSKNGYGSYLERLCLE